MAVRRRSLSDLRADDERFRTLRDRLVAEWRANTSANDTVPDIELQTDARDRVTQVVVTWDEWADLDAQTRSEIIVDAFEIVEGRDAILDLALAMGVTRAEAARIRGASA